MNPKIEVFTLLEKQIFDELSFDYIFEIVLCYTTTYEVIQVLFKCLTKRW